jgi:hypothetical protein
MDASPQKSKDYYGNIEGRVEYSCAPTLASRIALKVDVF